MKIANSVQIDESKLHGQPVHKLSLLEGCRQHVPHISKASEAAEILPTTSTISVSTHNWHTAYEAWRKEIFDADRGLKPNEQQGEILQSIHHRCVAEAVGEHSASSEPFQRLIHGLPGSGKSQLLKWIRTYFEKV